MMTVRINGWRDGVIGLVAVIGVVAYVLGAGVMGQMGFPLDDAWIHQTYARNLAQTGQWAFVPDVPSAGSTSPLYTLLLSAGYVLRLPYMLWTTLLGIVALAGAGWLAARMGERLLPEVRRIGWFTGLSTVVAWHLLWAAASGMETMIFATLTLALVVVAWRELDAPQDNARQMFLRGLGLGVLGALTMLTRPEGVGLLGLLGLLMWIAQPQGSWRGVLIWSAGVAVGWLAGSIPYALLNLSLGGSVLPNTASAKQAENAILLAISYPGRIVNLLFPLSAGGQLVLLPGVAAAVWVYGRRSVQERGNLLLLAPLIWAVALVGLYAARLPAPYQHGRYVIPILPHVIVLGVAGTAWLVQRGSGSLWGRVGGRTLALTAVALFVLFWGIGLNQHAQDVQIIESEMVVTARWLADNIAPDQLLAVHDIGAVGYYAPRPMLDLAGLVSRR
jgi:hypothetical protein